VLPLEECAPPVPELELELEVERELAPPDPVCAPPLPAEAVAASPLQLT